MCPRYRALNKRVGGTVTRRAASVRVAVWTQRSLYVLINGARYEREETCVTSPKTSHKVCTVYCFTINSGKPPVFMYCRAVGPSVVECGSKRNIDLYCTVRRGSEGRSNPKLGGKL